MRTSNSDQADLKTFKWEAAFASGDVLVVPAEGQDRFFFFFTNGTATGEVNVPADGEYTVTVEASCTEAKKVFAAFKLTVGDVVVTREHFLTAEDARAYTFAARLKKGKQPLAIQFLNDEYKESEYDRNLYAHGVKIEPKK